MDDIQKSLIGRIIKYNNSVGRVVTHEDTLRFKDHERSCYFSELTEIDIDLIQESTTQEHDNRLMQECKWMGKCIAVHRISEYQFVEYVNKHSGETSFSSYINENSTSHSYPSLDEAMIGTICHKYDGINSRAFFYITKMLCMP